MNILVEIVIGEHLMAANLFKVKNNKGRWSVLPPSALDDRCDIPLTNTKYQAIDAAREAALTFAPAVIEVIEDNGSISERIFVDEERVSS